MHTVIKVLCLFVSIMCIVPFTFFSLIALLGRFFSLPLICSSWMVHAIPALHAYADCGDHHSLSPLKKVDREDP